MSAAQIACPAGGMLHGQVSVTTEAQALAAESPDKPLFRGVLITNHDDTDFVYVGDADVASNTGHAVPPGQAIPYPIDDPSKLYVISAAGGETISWWGI